MTIKKVADIPISALSDEAPFNIKESGQNLKIKKKIKIKELKKIKIEDALIKNNVIT